jgi:hypothetical protein
MKYRVSYIYPRISLYARFRRPIPVSGGKKTRRIQARRKAPQQETKLRDRSLYHYTWCFLYWKEKLFQAGVVVPSIKR